jgi:hypothetical protein
MKKLLLIIIVCFGITALFGQARRIVLIEEATNASCAPCAANNPKLQAFFSNYFGGVISVRYHAWWPGYDPMYQLNISDNTARINYYSVSGVPNYMMDGVNYGVPGDPAAMATQMWQNLGNPSPVKIVVEDDIDADTVRANITLIGLAQVSQGMLHLRTAVIERKIEYASPPGTNGERVFPDVMRKLLPDANGILITSIDFGDTLSYQFKYPVGATWNWNDLAVVSWLQSDATTQVIQSSISLPTYIMESPDQTFDLLQLNQTYVKNYKIFNDNSDTLHLRIVADEEHLTAPWSYSLVFNSQQYDSFDVNLAPNDSLKFQLSFQTTNDAGSIKLSIFAKNLDDPHGYGFEQPYYGIIPQGDILFVDDDGGENYEARFFEAFNSAGVSYAIIGESDFISLSGQLDPSQFDAMFWNISWGFPAFIPEDITILENYLNNGGNLFLAGQDIGWDIFDPSGSSNFPQAKSFYNNFLDAQYINDNSGIYSMEGIPGDPITDGISFNITSIYSRYPEWIGSNSGTSVPILKYSGQERFGALRNDAGTYKTVYLGVGLEQMSDPQAAQLIVERTLNWFGVLTDIDPITEPIVQDFQLDQNYPNPFNPETRINFALPDMGEAKQATLTIYNQLGQKVITLINETKPFGRYEVVWNGNNSSGNQVSSGVYFYHLDYGDYSATKKMVLLR